MDALTILTCVYFAVFAIASWRTWHYAGKYDNETRSPLREEFRKRMTAWGCVACSFFFAGGVGYCLI